MADASSSSSAPPPVTRILSLCSSIYQQLHHHNRYHYRNHHYQQQQQQQQQGKLWSSALRVARWLWGVSSPLLRVGRFHGLAFSCTFACAWMALQLVIFEILDGPYRRSNPPDFRRVRAMCSRLEVSSENIHNTAVLLLVNDKPTASRNTSSTMVLSKEAKAKVCQSAVTFVGS